jgi:hypothetical protein
MQVMKPVEHPLVITGHYQLTTGAMSSDAVGLFFCAVQVVGQMLLSTV